MSNFIPNEVKTFCPRDPEWLNKDIKNLLRNQNKIFKRYKKMVIKTKIRLLWIVLKMSVKKLSKGLKKNI